MTNRFGALPEEWDHFDRVLGLTEDLLPVVSNPAAQPSEHSTLKTIGKTPSRFNGDGKVVGIKEWTQKRATPQEVANWAATPDLGLCIQTRYTRAIDVDIDDPGLAQKVWEYLDGYGFPARARENSPKFLLAFRLDGDYAKRVIRIKAGGAIEFLATGQQFVAAGTHPSGARYAWVNGLPDDLPALSGGEFEALWKGLNDAFGSGESTGGGEVQPRRTGAAEVTDDPVLAHLENIGQVISWGDGQVNIKCPFEREHTLDGDESATSYFIAGSRGYEKGHFKCLHAHCERRSDAAFLEALGYGGNWFEDLGPAEGEGETGGSPKVNIAREAGRSPPQPGITFIPSELFRQRPPPQWIIDQILPRADLGVLFGESGAGKTFLELDMALSLARGVPWNGFELEQTAVAYICAEGAGGMRNRLQAYCAFHNCSLEGVPLFISPDQPNLLEAEQAAAIARAIIAFGGAGVTFIDTLAQVMPGADENSAEDMGLAISHCRKISKATNSLVMLTHHAGKDLTKGARGWSGLRAAADCEIEVSRNEAGRFVRISKQKDGEDGKEWGLTLVPVNLDLDAKGRVITSCVAQYVAGVKRIIKQKQRGENERAILKAFDALGNVTATVDDLIAKALEYIPRDPQKRDQRRAYLRRAIGSLGADGVFDVSADIVTSSL